MGEDKKAPSRAGAAFVAALDDSPAGRAALARAKALLRDFGASVKMAGTSKPSEEALQQLTEAMRASCEAAGNDLAAQGFTTPVTVEDWEHLARIVEMPFETIQSGQFTAADVYVMALAWVDRQKLRKRITDEAQAKPMPKAPADYPLAALRELTGLSNATLNKYAKTAGFRTPRRGERNFRYTADQIQAILLEIIQTTSESSLRDRCQVALKSLQ